MVRSPSPGLIDQNDTTSLASGARGVTGSVVPGTPQTGATQSVIKSFGEGLLRGAASVAVSYTQQALNLDPLAGALATTALTGAVQGALNGGKVFEGIGTAFKGAIQETLTIGGPAADNPVARAQQLAKMNDFAQIIKGQGLSTAIETYATSILHRTSIEAMVNTFGSVGNAIKVGLERAKPTTINGQPGAELDLSTKDRTIKLLVATNPDGSKTLVSHQQGDTTVTGGMKVDPITREVIPVNATATRTYADGSTVQAVFDAQGKPTTVFIDTLKGNIELTPDEVGHLRLNADGTPKDGIARDTVTGVRVYYRDGKVMQTHTPLTTWLQFQQGADGKLKVGRPAETAYIETKYDATGGVKGTTFHTPAVTTLGDLLPIEKALADGLTRQAFDAATNLLNSQLPEGYKWHNGPQGMAVPGPMFPAMMGLTPDGKPVVAVAGATPTAQPVLFAEPLQDDSKKDPKGGPGIVESFFDRLLNGGKKLNNWEQYKTNGGQLVYNDWKQLSDGLQRLFPKEGVHIVPTDELTKFGPSDNGLGANERLPITTADVLDGLDLTKRADRIELERRLGYNPGTRFADSKSISIVRVKDVRSLNFRPLDGSSVGNELFQPNGHTAGGFLEGAIDSVRFSQSGGKPIPPDGVEVTSIAVQ